MSTKRPAILIKWVTVITVTSLLAGFLGIAYAQETIIAGRWVGGFKMEGEWTSVIVQFAAQGDSGYLFTLQDNRPLTLADVRLETSRVHFELIQATGTLVFDGDLADGIIFGYVARGEERGAFYLERLATITADDYDAYIGNYQLDSERRMLVARSDGVKQLFYLDSARQIALFPLGENRFFSGVGETITFVRDAQGEVTGLTIRQTHSPELSAEWFAPRVEAYREEEVHFQNGECVLAGTLLTPLTEGTHPAVILVHGAGAAERQIYRVFADHFVRQGIAALIYDKRGSGGSTGSQQAATLDDFAADALAGIRFLVNRLEIDQAQVGVWGISQGGRVAPMVAGLSQDVAFVIVGSAPGMDMHSLELQHNDRLYREAGYPDRVIEIGLKYGKFAQDLERLLAPGDSLSVDPDPISDWERVKQPVLMIYGAEDRIVPPDDSAAMIVEALLMGRNKDHTVVVFPEANHNLMVAKAEEHPAFAPGVMETMSAWILERAPEPMTFGQAEMVRVVPELDTTGEFNTMGRYGSRPWYGRAAPQLFLMLFFALVFLSASVGWLLMHLWRRGENTTPGRPARTDFLTGLISFLNLVVFTMFWIFVWSIVVPGDLTGISSYGVPPLLRVLPLLASLMAVLSLGLPLAAIRVWQEDTSPTTRRVHYLLVSLAALIFIWFTSYWNLSSFRL